MFLVSQYRIVYTMEEPGEQCTVVFALNATEPASECECGGGAAIPGPTLADSVTIYAKTTVHCSPDASMDYITTVHCPKYYDNYLIILGDNAPRKVYNVNPMFLVYVTYVRKSFFDDSPVRLQHGVAV